MAKTKRKKMIYAGRLVFGLVYTPPRARDPSHVRQARQRISSAARKALNMRASFRRLEFLLAANFDFRDIHVTLTYDDQNIPTDKREAAKRMKKLLVQLRQYRKPRGQPLRYVYVTEGAHSGGRLHHHLILNGGESDRELLRSLWPYGADVHVERLDVYGGYEALAMYLTKEPREQGRPKPGERMWSASQGLVKPREINEWIDDATTLTPPPGVTVLDGGGKRNEFGEFVYLKYLQPLEKPRKTRPPRRGKGTDSLSFSVLKPCITNEQRQRKGGKGVAAAKK